MRGMTAARAYQQATRHRTLREQDADVFRRVNAALRTAGEGDPARRATAVADNERLWLLLMDLMRDPANPLPRPLRAAVVSIGHTVRREAGQARPDRAFLIGLNEQVADGLSAQG